MPRTTTVREHERAIVPTRPNQKGRKFKPTDEERDKARTMAGLGLSNEQIGHLIRQGVVIDHDTVTKYFKREIEQGKSAAILKIANTLYNQAIGGNVACMMFWLKTRARWRESDRHDGPLGEDGKPLVPKSGVLLIPKAVAVEDWEKMAESQQRELMDMARRDA
jgi:hypothetical protein